MWLGRCGDPACRAEPENILGYVPCPLRGVGF